MVTLGLMPSWKVETSALSQKDHVSTDTANKEAGLFFFFFILFSAFSLCFHRINLESLREEL